MEVDYEFQLPLLIDPDELKWVKDLEIITREIQSWMNENNSLAKKIWTDVKFGNFHISDRISPKSLDTDFLADGILKIISQKRFNYQSKNKINQQLQLEREKIVGQIMKYEPIHFVLLYNGGYRASNNGKLDELIFEPDQTELMLLFQISLLQERIVKIYPPGIKFDIVINNGVAYWVNNISLESTSIYANKLRKMLELLGASCRIEVVVQSELEDFHPEFDLSKLNERELIVHDETELNRIQKIVERFLGRNCTTQEAINRWNMYELAETYWGNTLMHLYHDKSVVFFRQVQHLNMLSFRSFPGGAARIQNGTVGFVYENAKLIVKLITTSVMKEYVVINVKWSNNDS